MWVKTLPALAVYMFPCRHALCSSSVSLQHFDEDVYNQIYSVIQANYCANIQEDKVKFILLFEK